jgi:hypothetical protein
VILRLALNISIDAISTFNGGISEPVGTYGVINMSATVSMVMRFFSKGFLPHAP